METDKPKGEMTPREAAAQDAAPARQEPARTRLPTEDEREEEGWDQPESSAQKGAQWAGQ